jgi:hypothetical protein
MKETKQSLSNIKTKKRKINYKTENLKEIKFNKS